ncbi:MAG: RNA-protein complex protein Nop10 [Thermofilum sp.]|nr:RNA-protein complex protein Nop10 [Thermofilum sp.]
MSRRGVLRYCPRCQLYTLQQDKCPRCGGPVRVPHPAKYSPEDRYGEYRRKAKLELLRKQSQNRPAG